MENELARPMAVSEIGETGRTISISADDEERRRIAARLDLSALPLLRAALDIHRRSDGLIAVTGDGTAEVEHQCVVTLEPFLRSYRFDVEGLYDPSIQAVTPATEIEVDPIAEDPPEPAPDGRIDLGELVVQELAVSLDPFPRAPGVAFDTSFEPTLGDGGAFAALRQLRGGRS